jgi:hypothetical protein
MSTTESPILPDHILGAILCLAEKQLREKDSSRKRLEFRVYDFKLQDIFNTLQKSHPILNAFVFTDRGPEPYSPALEKSVSRLQLSGLIGRENPDYEVVFVQEAAERFYEQVLRHELADKLADLNDVAAQFLGMIDVV